MSKRTNRFKVSCTGKEDERLEKLAEQAGIPKARYVREVALGKRQQDMLESEKKRGGLTSQKIAESDLKELLKELSASGNNLNQLAKDNNTFGQVNQQRLEQVLKNQETLQERVMKILM